MTADTHPAFSSLVTIPHDKRFIIMARSHVENLARMAGADDRELDALALMTEESLAFIIAKYPDSPFGAHVEVGFSLASDGEAVISLVDIGPPIRKDRIPAYDIDDESSLAGLWLHLVKAFADDVSFTRRKDSGGWIIRLGKRLAAPCFDTVAGIDDGADDTPQAPAAKTNNRIATPEDAPALVDLIYKTYRYSYNDAFYDDSVLAELIGSGDQEYIIVERGGDLLGAVGVKLSPDGRTAEIGTAMVAPEHRDGAAVRRLFVNITRYLRENSRDCEFFFADAVTTHDRSQRLLAKVDTGFRTGFLFLNMVRRFAFVGLSDLQGGYESPLFVYLFKKTPEIKQLFAPPTHRDMARTLLENLGISAEVETKPAAEVAQRSVLHIQSYEVARFGHIDVATAGKDIAKRLSRALLALMEQGIEGINVNIAADAPLPEGLDDDLTALFLVFSGVTFRPGGKVMLAYSLVLKPVEFDEIHLSDPISQQLLDYIKAHCARLGDRD